MIKAMLVGGRRAVFVMNQSFSIATFALCTSLAAGCAAGHREHRVGVADAMPPLPRAIESGDLRARPGYTGDRIGVRILGVTDLPEEDLQAIDLAVPLEAERIDRVEVFSPGGRQIEQVQAAEVKQLGDRENTGLRIYLPRFKNLEFRIRLIDESDDF